MCRLKKDTYRRKISSIHKALKDPTSLGNLLLRTRLITDSQLDEACRFQWKNESLRLGEALVQLGLIDKEIMDAVIEEQKHMRSSVVEKSTIVLEHAEQATKRTLEVGASLESLGDLILQAKSSAKEFG